LSTCGCCDGEHIEPDIYNRPGQPALSYRVGTHATFLRRMLAQLARQAIPDGPNQGSRPLANLGTRSSADPSIAFMDACATVADVLSFYQERIANEGFLRTATERRSVLELARAIGYELDPGVAASTFLAFTVEDAPGAPEEAFVAAGTRVLSIPGQVELPQTFETGTDIAARAAWNAMRAQLTTPQAIQRGTTRLFLKGVSTLLQPGDAILLVGDARVQYPGSERWDFRILQTVTPFPEQGYTLVTWEIGLGHDKPTVEPADNPRVYAFRQRAALFGHNAPDWRAMPDSIKQAYDPNYDPQDPSTRRTQWPDFEIQGNRIDLDAKYPKVLRGSWVVLVKPSYAELYLAQDVDFDSRTDYTLTAQVTRIVPDGVEHLSWFGLRDTVVYAQSEELELIEEPVVTPVQGDIIALDELVEGLQPGQAIVVSGLPETAGGDDVVSEVAFIESVTQDAERTTLELAESLVNVYERTSVSINANVVAASHGETTSEVLGSGDGSVANQRFVLRKPPLTYVSAPTPSGSESTLEVRVNQVLWREVPSLFGLSPRDEAYIVRLDDDGKPRVVFGDGQMGARLPSGQENVAATYRSGIGPDGEVDAGALSLLQTRPLGVRGVTNPVPATGAAAPEVLDEARANAPFTVLTLDRIVSLLDFENFARAFAGIGKAQATSLWAGETRIVHITVATASGGAVDPSSALYENLSNGVDLARDPVQEVRIASFEQVLFKLGARVLVDSRYVAADVLAAVADALRAAFSFEQRGFGQAVTAAEIIRIIQGVQGVIATDLDRLYLSTDPNGPAQTTPPPYLLTMIARWVGTTIAPAQLLLLDPSGVELTEMTA
jgi:predicted phage baseplate assembly protein